MADLGTGSAQAMMATTGAAEPLYLADPPVFCLLHRPDGGAATSGTAVVLCADFGWAAEASHRQIHALARDLAGRGHLALRFDLPGSGDSAGMAGDPGLVDRWRVAVADTVAFVAEQPGVERVVAVGIGLGGLLALDALRDGVPFAGVVAWATPRRGRAYVRELTAFGKLEAAVRAAAGMQEASDDVDGAVVAGHRLSSETIERLGAIDLGEFAPGTLDGRRVLLLGRQGPGVDERLRTALAEAGADVTTGDGRELADMSGEPQDAQRPREAFAAVTAWLDGPWAPIAAAGDQRTVAVGREARIVHEGAEIVERPVTFELPTGRLFGIWTEPETARNDVCVLFLAAGLLDHIGPNRLWVEAARDAARAGVRALRIDMATIGESVGGESDAVDSRYPTVGHYYRDEVVEEARSLLDHLERSGQASRFAVVGLCSGGWLSLQLAAADPRVVTVLSVNPGAFVWGEDLQSARDARRWRRVFQAEPWRNLRREPGQLPARAGRVGRGMLAQARLRLGNRGGGRGSGSFASPIELLAAIERHGSRAAVLFGGREHSRDELEADPQVGRIDGWPRITVRRLSDVSDTHLLRPISLQRGFRDQVAELIAELARHTV